MLAYMNDRKYRVVCPRHPPAGMPKKSIFSHFNSNYISRGVQNFYFHGDRYPYKYNSNYYSDWWMFQYGALHDDHVDIH